MDEVVVDVQTLARAELQPPLFRVLRAVVLEAHAGLDGGERTDEPRLRERMLGEQRPREVFLARSRRFEIARRPTQPLRRRERGLLHSLAGLEREVLEIEQPGLRARQEHMHPTVTD